MMFNQLEMAIEEIKHLRNNNLENEEFIFTNLVFHSILENKFEFFNELIANGSEIERFVNLIDKAKILESFYNESLKNYKVIIRLL